MNNNLPEIDTQYALGNKNLYRVHCLTFGMAKEIFGYSRECNLATPGNHVLATFRAYPKGRKPGAKALRAEVCERLKAERWANAQKRYWIQTAGREMRQP